MKLVNGLVIGGLIFLGCNQQQTSSSSENKTDSVAAPAPAPVISDSLKAVLAKGQEVYNKHCVTCHQAGGDGVPNLNPPLTGTDYVLGDKTRLINVVLKGLNEDVEINGMVYSNPMPAHAFLNDQEVADVLTYVRNSFGNTAEGITKEEVKAVRAAK
ncbi:c-type cytochrome [Chitinophaga cymbidii]|uniref:Cytochrome c domain-containing protein n=1 Tax=Chitinophaga cymbidii TaxID=1096750 RepID=A0A512RTB7_9BACT|nr:cytochrome c [Chitinophaga cymbidii]GEP98924.1 hypothetical protein CCY01nite_51840 [Chitinophaga cymbidii]